jgi:CBS domain-containing protein
VIQPDGLLTDGQGEAVAVGIRVGHGRSGYPNPIKATQPAEVFAEDTLTEAVQDMLKTDVCGLPVVGGDGDLPGVITISNVMRVMVGATRPVPAPVCPPGRAAVLPDLGSREP